MFVRRCESSLRSIAGSINGQTDAPKIMTSIKTETMMRVRFPGSRERGVVKINAAMNPRMANFLLPNIIHDMGGENDNAGELLARAKIRISASGMK